VFRETTVSKPGFCVVSHVTVGSQERGGWGDGNAQGVNCYNTQEGKKGSTSSQVRRTPKKIG